MNGSTYIKNSVRIVRDEHIQGHILIAEKKFPTRLQAPVLRLWLRKWNEMGISGVRAAQLLSRFCPQRFDCTEWKSNHAKENGNNEQ